MGSITSRPWPPQSFKRYTGRVNKTFDPATGKCETEPDYVWVRPGIDLPANGGSGVTARWDEEMSPSQESAFRHLEDG